MNEVMAHPFDAKVRAIGGVEDMKQIIPGWQRPWDTAVSGAFCLLVRYPHPRSGSKSLVWGGVHAKKGIPVGVDKVCPTIMAFYRGRRWRRCCEGSSSQEKGGQSGSSTTVFRFRVPLQTSHSEKATLLVECLRIVPTSLVPC